MLMGCAKCATTALATELTSTSKHWVPAKVLGDDPAFYWKEPHFLDFLAVPAVDDKVRADYLRRFPLLTDPVPQGKVPAVEGTHMFKALPAVTMDATPLMHRPEISGVVRAMFPAKADRDATRMVAVLRDPSKRAVSQYHFNIPREFGYHVASPLADAAASAGGPPRPLKDVVAAEVADIEHCQRTHGRDWYATCYRERDETWFQPPFNTSLPSVWLGMYAEQLRLWYCTFMGNGGDGVDGPPHACFDWEDTTGDWVGGLSPARQNQFLILSQDDVSKRLDATLDATLQFVGLPAERGTDPAEFYKLWEPRARPLWAVNLAAGKVSEAAAKGVHMQRFDSHSGSAASTGTGTGTGTSTTSTSASTSAASSSRKLTPDGRARSSGQGGSPVAARAVPDASPAPLPPSHGRALEGEFNQQHYDRPSPEVVEALKRHFTADAQHLHLLTGRDFGWPLHKP